MILYGVDNIRDLFGTKARTLNALNVCASLKLVRALQVNLSMIKSNPICKLSLAPPE
jgi:hypothetical protein